MLVFAMIGRNVEALWPRKIMHTDVPTKLCNCLFPSARTGRVDMFAEREAFLVNFVDELGYRQWRCEDENSTANRVALVECVSIEHEMLFHH